MPNSIDNKIVEMQFDNANFEKNVKQSIQTLEKLNKALELDEATEGFRQMEKAANDVDFTALTRAAEMIEKRFSAAGIAGAAMIERLTNSAINMVTGFGKKVVNLAKSGGIARAFKLEHANFMLNGLIKDANRVAEILNGPVNNAVSGTAYGLDAAANAAAQFVASGVKDMKKLEAALTGISGVAAMTGASYEEIADIFSSVSGKGKAMTMDLNRINQRGVNATAAIAKYLNKTEAEVRDMASKSKISFEIFAEAMNEAFGEQAKKANDTFTGAMSNVKAALSRIGAKIATPAIEEMRKVLVKVIDLVNNINKILSESLIKKIVTVIERLGEFARRVVSNKKILTVVKGAVDNLSEGFDRLSDLLWIVSSAFKNIFPKSALDMLISFNKQVDKFLYRIRISAEDAAKLEMTLEGLFSIIDIIFTLVSQVLDVVAPGLNKIFDASDSLASKILSVTSYVGFCIKQFDAWLKQNNVLKKGLEGLTKAIKSLTSETNIFKRIFEGIGTVLLGVIGIFFIIGSAVVEFIKQVAQLPAVKAIVNDLKDAIVKLGEMAVPILGFLADAFVSLLDSMQNFAQGGYMTKGLEKLNDVLNNLYWGGQNAVGAIGAFFNIFKKNDDAITKIDKVVVASEKLYGSAEAIAGSSGVVVRETNGVEAGITELDESVTTFAKDTEENMKSLKRAGDLFVIGFGASIISAGINIGRAFKQIGNVARNISSTTKSIKIFFEQLQLNLRIKTLLSLAVAIAVFAGSLWVLCQVPPARLILASIAIGALTYALAGAAKVISSTDIHAIHKLSASTKSILKFALALGVLAVSVKILSSIGHDWQSLAVGLAGLTGVIILMTAAMWFLGKYQKEAVKGTASLIAFAASIYIISAALQKIANLDAKKIWAVLPPIAAIMAVMAGLTLLMSFTISPMGGLSFLGVVAGVLLLAEGLSLLGGIDAKSLRQVKAIIEMIGDVINSIMVFLVILSALELAKALVDRSVVLARGITGGLKNMFAVLQKGVKYIGVAAIIISIGVAIYLIGDTIVKLGIMWEQHKGSMIAATIFIMAIAVFVGVMAMKFIEITQNTIMAGKEAQKFGLGLIGIAALLLSVTASIAILGNMDPNIFGQGIFFLGMLLLLISGFIMVLALISKELGPVLKTSYKTVLSLAVMIGALVVLVGVLGLLASFDSEALLLGVGMLVVILGILSVVFYAVGTMGEMSTQTVVAVGLIALVLATLTGCLILLQQVTTFNVVPNVLMLLAMVAYMVEVIQRLANMKGDIDQAITALLAISICFSLIATAGFILSYANPVTLLENLVLLSAATAGLYLLFKTLANMEGNVAKGAVAMAAISATLLLLSISAAIINTVDPKTLESNMIYLLGAVVVLGVAMAVLGGLSEFTGIGAIILLAIGAAMIEFATAAAIFGVAVNLVAIGMNLMAKTLQDLSKVDITAIAKGLTELAVSFSFLAVYSVGLMAATLALEGFVIVAFVAFVQVTLLATAFEKLTTSLATFVTMDLTNMTFQMNALADAVRVFNQHALELLEFSAIAIVVGEALAILSVGVEGIAIAFDTLAVGINLVLIAFSAFVMSVSTLAASITLITTSINDLINDIKDLGAKTISEILDNLLKFSFEQLPDAGRSMVKHICDGFNDAAIEMAPEFCSNLIDGISNELKNSESDLYQIGYDMIDQLCEGMEDSAEINSPSKRTAGYGGYLVQGLTDRLDELEPTLTKSGTDTATAWFNGFEDYSGIHSKSKRMMDNADYMEEGFSYEIDQLSPDFNAAGSSAASSFSGGFLSGIWSTLKNAGNMLTDWTNNKFGPLAGYLGNQEQGEGNILDSIFGSSYSSGHKTRQELYEEELKKKTAKYGRGLTYLPRMQLGKGEDAKRADLMGYSLEEYAKLSQQGYFDTKEALDEETAALGSNSGATGKNSKAKEKNKEANEKKNKSIDDESEALSEETEEAEDNSEAIRELAEQIEVVTAEFDTLNNTLYYNDGFKSASKLTKAMSKFWSQGLSSDGFVKNKNITKSFNELSKTLAKTTKTVKKAAYQFGDSGKYISKLSKKFTNNTKKIEQQVLKTGRTIAKVTEGQAIIFEKAGNSVNKYTMRLTKNIKNLSKRFKEMKAFTDQMNRMDTFDNVMYSERAEDFIEKLRQIEKYYTKFSSMPAGVKRYMTDINEKMKELNGAMNVLGKNIDGVGNYMSKNSQATAYVQDAFISLAASLYDGSEAANEYATEHARLLFLLENGEATEEEVAAHFQSYIKRITDALVEYRNSIEENLRGSLDIFSEFNQNLLAEGTDLISNIESQIAGYTNWSNMLLELSNRGFDSNILKMLVDEGVSSYGKLKALLSMTADELALFTTRYKESEEAVTHARDASLAALANATTMASLRAAAAAGNKVAKKQLEQSKKRAKQLINDAKAVADNQARYRSLTKKEEAQYLKSLTEAERKAYKERKKYQEKLLKTEQKAAKREETKRKERKTIDDTVKSYADLVKAYTKYINNSNVINYINEKLTKTLEKVKDSITAFGGNTVEDMQYSWLAFAETLESTGNESNDFFTEMQSRLETYIKTIEDATKATNKLFQKFEKAEAMKIGDLLNNAASQLAGQAEFQSLSKELSARNVSSRVFSYIYENYVKNGDLAGASEFMRSIVNATEDQIKELEADLIKMEGVEKESAKVWSNAQANSTGAAAAKAVIDAENAQKKAQSVFDEANKKYKAAQNRFNSEQQIYNKELAAYEKARQQAYATGNGKKWDKQNRGWKAELDNLKSNLNKANNELYFAAQAYNNAKTGLDKANKDLTDKQINAEKNATVDTATAILKERSNQTTAARKALEDEKKRETDLVNQRQELVKQLEKAEMGTTRFDKKTGLTYQYVDVKKVKELKKQIKDIDKQITQSKAKQTEAEKKLAKAIEEETRAQRTLDRTTASAEALRKKEEALRNLIKSVTSTELLAKALKNASISAEGLARLRSTLSDNLVDVAEAINYYGESWKGIDGLADKVSPELDEISVAFMRLAETLGDANEESDDWFANMGTRLSEYRETIDSALKSSITLFDEFKKFSGEDPTSANEYLNNMTSNIEGVKEWLSLLEKASKRGIDAGLIQMFASEGTGSFEKLYAFANATNEQIGDLNKTYREYNEVMEKAADKAVASVAAAYTDTALALQDAMIKQFEDSGMVRLEDAAYNAGAMIISGVKDGVGDSMPEIISTVAKTADEVARTMGNGISAQKVSQAVTEGLSSIDAAIATTLTLTLDNFYDTITGQAVEKFKMAVDSINGYIGENLPTEWTITVNVDASEMDAAIARMNAAVGGTNAQAMTTSSDIVASQENQQALNAPASAEPTTVSNNYTINQTNYSPKAISPKDAYKATDQAGRALVTKINMMNGH